MKEKGLAAILLICLASVLVACDRDDHGFGRKVTKIADKVWTFSQSHPDGFTLDIHTMTCPAEGIAVSYATTQNSHSRDQLEYVVSHALQHDGYVGGWFSRDEGLYYFDSTRLFPEDSLDAAIWFGKENGQHSVFILSSSTDIPLTGKVAQIIERGQLLAGTTGDYRPLSYKEPETGQYWGFCLDVAGEIAKTLNVTLSYVPTSWPMLSADVQAEPQTFDLALCGITITDTRKETMLMSDGYLANGKTILCRAADTGRYQSLADIDKPQVRVMVNPGGLNEKFARANLPNCTLIVFDKNEEIPNQVAIGNADVMITEITEAPWYVQNDPRLAAPLLDKPFTHGEIGVLMRKGQDDLLALVNAVIARMKADGTLRRLHEKYGLTYAY
jgi:ABC-type amino acid transport substrate-binding protein